MKPTHMKAYMNVFLGILHGERAAGGPIRATLGLTNRCNLRCIHCFYYSPFVEKPSLQPLRLAQRLSEKEPKTNELRELQRADIDVDVARDIVKDLMRIGTGRFEFAGNGEPFLYSRILDVLSLVKERNGRCFVKTNGTLVDRAMAGELIRLGVDELRFTTLAGSPEMYMITHHDVSDSIFDRLKETLLYMAEQKAARNVMFPRITLSYVVLRQNIEGLYDFARFAAEVKADQVRYWPVDAVDDTGLRNVVPTEEQMPALLAQIERAKEYLRKTRIPFTIYDPLPVFYTKLNTSSIYHRIPCYYGWLAVRISADGEVYACCRCYRSLGNVYDQDFEKIWNGEAYRQFRKEARSHPKRKEPVTGCDCYSCIHFKANNRVYHILHPYRRQPVCS